MQNYIRSIGFSMYKKKTEVRELLDKIQRENIASARIVVTKEKERLWEIRKDISPSLGLCIHGYMENLGFFIREGFYPYMKNTVTSSTSSCSAERYVDGINYFGMLDDGRLGMSLIFRLSNSLDYIDNANTSIKSTSLFGFCNDAKVLLPIKQSVAELEIAKQRIFNRDLFFEVQKFSTDFINLTEEDVIINSTLNSRIQNEDLYSIVDTLFMPFGMATDMYSIIGKILDFSQEENSETGETIMILKIESSDIIFTIAIRKDDLQGEPLIGRRFKGNVWLNGRIKL